MKVAMGALLLLLLSACGQDPFPKTGAIQVNPPEPEKPIPPPFVIEVPKAVDVKEDEEREVTLRVQVPAPGTPEVTVSDLPPGATFDPKTLRFFWKPSFDQGNEPNDPTSFYRVYPVTFTLRSTADKLTMVHEEVQFIVHDVSRPVTLEALPAKFEFRENKLAQFQVKVKSEDFPGGQFDLRSPNLPMGATISRVSGTGDQFMIRFTPDLNTVTVFDPWSGTNHYKEVSVDYIVVSPNAKTGTAKNIWRILDERQPARITAPPAVIQGLDVNFTVTGDDPNGETPPKISLQSNPAFGKVELANLEVITTRPNPLRSVALRWTGIPLDKIGTKHTLNFNVCVHKQWGDFANCKTQPVSVSISGESISGPKFDRTNFPLGEVKYVKVSEELKTMIDIRNPVAMEVKIEPAALAEEISWERGILKIKPKKIGMKQFNIVATSSNGIATSESFVVDALPWSWSDVLVLGESFADPEVTKVLGLFDSAQLANPQLQDLSSKVGALRKTLVITTSALKMSAELPAIEDLAATVKNVLILSPLAGEFQGKLKAELGALKLTPKERFLDLPDEPKLAEFQLVANTGLTALTKPVKMGGALTSESKSPLTMEADAIKCLSRLKLHRENPELNLGVAFVCNRAKGGKLFVSGIEFGDMKTSTEDEQIGKRWVSEVLK